MEILSDKAVVGSFRSTNGSDSIQYRLYSPSGHARAVVQFSHGMCEYVARYGALAEYLCARGIAFCGNDHIGHGGSASDAARLGLIPGRDGWGNMVDDLAVMTKIARKKWPGVPLVLLGRSMGSFLARAYMARYGSYIDGAIIAATGDNPRAGAGKMIAAAVAKARGEDYRSAFLNDAAFGRYNDRIPNPRTRFDWLTHDADAVDRYMSDPLCAYVFTASGFRNMAAVLEYVSREDWAKKVPAALPILIESGDEDPVGDYGRAPRAVAKKLRESGHTDVTLKLYHGARHELYNELDRAEVCRDTAAWIEKLIG